VTQDRVELTWVYAQQDFVDAVGAARRRPATRRQRRVTWGVIATAVVVGLVTRSVVLTVFGLAALGGVLYQSKRRIAVRLMRKLRVEGVLISASVSSDGIVLSQPTGTTTWTWAAFTGFVDTPSCFVLHLKTTTLVLLPKRGVTVGSVELLQELIAQGTRHPA
jgi:YcxB-like protein